MDIRGDINSIEGMTFILAIGDKLYFTKSGRKGIFWIDQTDLNWGGKLEQLVQTAPKVVSFAEVRTLAISAGLYIEKLEKLSSFEELASEVGALKEAASLNEERLQQKARELEVMSKVQVEAISERMGAAFEGRNAFPTIAHKAEPPEDLAETFAEAYRLNRENMRLRSDLVDWKYYTLMCSLISCALAFAWLLELKPWRVVVL